MSRTTWNMIFIVENSGGPSPLPVHMHVSLWVYTAMGTHTWQAYEVALRRGRNRERRSQAWGEWEKKNWHWHHCHPLSTVGAANPKFRRLGGLNPIYFLTIPGVRSPRSAMGRVGFPLRPPLGLQTPPLAGPPFMCNSCQHWWHGRSPNSLGVFACLFFLFSFFFLGLHLWYMEVPRLGVKCVYTIATATADSSRMLDLRCSWQQHCILNPLSKAASLGTFCWVLNPLNHRGNSQQPLLT